MLERLGTKLLMTALGTAAVLGYWTITGHHTTAANTGPAKMPAKFLAGGGGTLTIEANSSTPATFHYTLHGPLENGSAKDKVDGWEEIEAGPHSWTTEIAPNTGVYFELEAKNPPAGAKLNWTVKLNGKEIDTEDESLQEALKPNEAFFLQCVRDDVTKAESADGE